MPSEGARAVALECFTFTVSESEAASIHAFLGEHGFDPNSQGLKEFLLVNVGEKENENGDAPPGGLSEGVARLAEAMHRHPEVAATIKKEGARIAGSLLRRIVS